jgi:RNA polymerase sigma factor (sigma-70 family)
MAAARRLRSGKSTAAPTGYARGRVTEAAADLPELLAAAKAGSPAALDTLCARYYARVQMQVHHAMSAGIRARKPWLTAMFSTGDVVQEVFLRVLRDLPRFEGTGEAQFVAWLAASMQHRLVDAVRFHQALQRDQRRSEPTADDVLPGREAEPVQPLITRDALVRYEAALAALPPRERELLEARLTAVDTPTPFEALAPQLGYPSAAAARKAFFLAKARVLRRMGAGS